MQNIEKKLQFSKEARYLQELNWYANKQTVENDKFYQVKDGIVKEYTPTWVTRVINTIRPLIRWVRTLITKNNPRWHIKDSLETWHKDTETYIAWLVLNNIYKWEHLKTKVKDLLYNGSIAWNWYWQVYYDTTKDDQWDIAIQNIDPFDIYLDPTGKVDWSKFNWRWIIKSITKPVSEIHNDKKYNKEKFNISPKTDDTLKTYQEQLETSTDSEIWVATIYEIYEKENWKIKLITYWQGYILREIILDTDEFPIFIYQMERMWGRIYPTAWITPLLWLNKANSRIASMIEEWIYINAKGRWWIREWENIKSSLTDRWELIYYKNMPPTYLQQGSIWNTPFNYTSMLQSWMQDIWWLHSVSAGKVDNSIRTGIGIAQLQASDLNNISEAVDNLKEFLWTIAEYVLNMASKEYTTVKKLYYVKEDVQVVWNTKKQYSDKVKKVVPFKWIDVEIIPWSAFSDLQSRQDMIQLLQLWVKIPNDILIDTFELWDTWQILRKMELEKDKNQDPDIDIANAENKKMIMKEPITASQTDNHQVHLAIHWQLLDWVKDNKEVSQIVMQHMKQHEALMKGTQAPDQQAIMQQMMQWWQPQQQWWWQPQQQWWWQTIWDIFKK